MVHFSEINKVPSPYSMLQHNGRVATPNLVPRNSLRYLQAALTMEGGGLVSQFMWGIVCSWNFWWFANSILNKYESALPPLFSCPEVSPSVSDKAKLFAEIFSKNSYLDDSGIALTVFPSWTNMKLHNISVTPKMVKKS